ncbi:unknown [[Mannheimia] succiniciproducens MBEL55E]|uniref:Uncharacterized protein n=1 Tax=Mannheimia succiniciproducens (strain KCTC 0769BP / MBEL55E) TaxID=221988 RepID=Q65QP5_MANSM|nr:unknown [[Mannheimia] succiniciproducens MBEL55E]
MGYRVNSVLGTKFRIWATARLKDYLTKGYAINQQHLSQNAHELEQALALIQKTAKSSGLTLESVWWTLSAVIRKHFYCLQAAEKR